MSYAVVTIKKCAECEKEGRVVTASYLQVNLKDTFDSRGVYAADFVPVCASHINRNQPYTQQPWEQESSYSYDKWPVRNIEETLQLVTAEFWDFMNFAFGQLQDSGDNYHSIKNDVREKLDSLVGKNFTNTESFMAGRFRADLEHLQEIFLEVRSCSAALVSKENYS
jgi:hypothetical protein